MKKIIIIAITAIVCSAIIGGSFYAIQVNKQQSIEKQQEIKIESEKEIESAKVEQEQIQAQKEYAAKMKDSCLDIYKTEDDKWSNINGWRYDEDEDTCYIRYKASPAKSDEECDEQYPVGDDWGYIFSHDRRLCKNGEFENSF